MNDFQFQNTTKVYFELDVFQTWLYDCRILPSYVLKEHCQLYNGDKPVINTVDEGLDYGSDYQIIKTSTHKANYGIRWIVVVMKTRVDDDTGCHKKRAIRLFVFSKNSVIDQMLSAMSGICAAL